MALGGGVAPSIIYFCAAVLAAAATPHRRIAPIVLTILVAPATSLALKAAAVRLEI